MPLASDKMSDKQIASLRNAGVPVVLVPHGSTGFNVQASSFEGANRGRRLSSWGTSGAGPNSVLGWNLATLRNRSHEFVRNHPLAQNAIDTYVSNLVGTGIVPRWKLPKDQADLKKRLQKRWLRWTDEADAAGVCDFYGLQALAARTIMESGEVLIRRRNRRRSDGLTVPLQLQAMEPDHLPLGLNREGGNEIQMGIEFDGIGRRAAYHITRRHPGDQFANGTADTTRVLADDLIHSFRPLRPGQLRGIPWLTTVIVRLHELDQYTDAELVRKKTAAMFAGFITSPMDEDPTPGLNLGTDSAGRGLVGLQPGTMQYLNPGEEIEFSAPADVGANTLSWMQQQLREIAVGIGVTYEQLTGDLSNVNFSSLRAGLVEFRRRCEMLIFHLLVFQVCRPIVGWWMDSLVLNGIEKIPGYWENRADYLDVEWFAPGWEYVNPVDDRIAEQMDIRNGLDSRQSVIAHRRGRDAEEVDEEIRQDNERSDGLGLILDSDPRQTAKSGVIQAAERAVAERGNGGQQ